MIKGSGEMDGLPVFIFGLSRENTRRLHEGQPIKIDLAPLHGVGTVIILAGETEDSIAAELTSLLKGRIET